MKKPSFAAALSLAVLILCAGLAKSQQAAARKAAPRTAALRPASGDKPLVLTETIPLDDVKGRFDHFAMGGGRLFIAAIGANAVEVINIGGRVLERALPVPGPQGIAYSAETGKIFVGSSQGKLYVFDSKSYERLAAIDFEGGADNLRYDPAAKRVYVGCGDDEKTGAIAVVDAATNRRLDEEYKLGGEPESFQLEKSGPNIYVNVPDLKQVVVVNRATKKITRWPLAGVSGNFPMALDEADRRLFVGVHAPPRVAVLDTASGRMVATLPSPQDSDDLYFDADRKRIYAPGGEGYLAALQMIDPDHYQLLEKIPTAIGAKTAGYYGKQGKGFDRFYLAVPARGRESAEVRIYTVQD